MADLVQQGPVPAQSPQYKPPVSPQSTQPNQPPPPPMPPDGEKKGHREYPRWMHHKDEDSVLVENAQEEKSLPAGYSDKPIDTVEMAKRRTAAYKKEMAESKQK
jgi:hypothetical protein